MELNLGSTQYLVAFLGIVLGSNGIVIFALKRIFEKQDRNDSKNKKIDELCKLNNRHSRELLLFSDSMECFVAAMNMIVIAMHEKGILNGNSVPIKEMLDEVSSGLSNYSKKLREEMLMYKEEK